MFFDELEKIDRASAVDSRFSKVARGAGPESYGNDARFQRELNGRDEKHQNVGESLEHSLKLKEVNERRKRVKESRQRTDSQT